MHITIKEERRIWSCTNQLCKNSCYILSPLPFSKVKLSESDALLMYYHFCIGEPIKCVVNHINLSKKTVRRWYAVFREQIIIKYNEEAPLIKFDQAQVDESLFAKRKYNVGKRVRNQWIFGICDAHPGGKVFMYCVQRRDAKNLLPKIKKHTHIDSIVTSDEWKVYYKIEEMDRQHMVVIHTEHYTDPITFATTNRIEGLWGTCKEWLKKMNYNKAKNTADYIIEYCYRYNHEKSFWDLWQNLYR